MNPRLAAWLTALWLAVFVAGLARGMAVYPGGSWADPRAEGFAFWVNYWCDLMSAVSWNGRPNDASVLASRAAFLALGLGTGSFWWAVRPLIARPGVALAVVVCGCVGSGITATIAFAPYDTHRMLHAVLALLAGGCGLVAATVVLVATYRAAPWWCRAAGLAFAATGVAHLVIYAGLVIRGGGDSAALPVVQKIATALLLLWVAATLVVARAAATCDPGPGTHNGADR